MAWLVPLLAGRAHVVSYDCRGFGESAMPPGPFSRLDDLFALLDEVGNGPVWLVAAHLAAVSRSTPRWSRPGASPVSSSSGQPYAPRRSVEASIRTRDGSPTPTRPPSKPAISPR